MEQATETLPAAIERLGLSIRAEFVPFSRSRNAKPDAKPSDRSLNWRVTLVRRTMNSAGDARYHDVVTTDYQAGIAHCPAYNLSVKEAGHANSMMRGDMIKHETETGRAYTRYANGKAIAPAPADVIYSLALDADVLDSGGFEEWASEFGYDTDSRKAEAIYRACLDIALKLRAGIGEGDLAALRAAAREY